MDFGESNGEAVFVGTSPQESLILSNQGLENLTFNVTKTGDPEFIMDPPLKTELKGKEQTFLRVVFCPTSAPGRDGGTKLFTGEISIDGNHEVIPPSTLPDGGSHPGWPNPVRIELRGRSLPSDLPDGGLRTSRSLASCTQ